MYVVHIENMSEVERLILARLEVETFTQGMDENRALLIKKNSNLMSNSFQEVIYTSIPEEVGAILPKNSLLILEMSDLERLTKHKLASALDVERAVAQLADLGARDVLILGFSPDSSWCYHFWMGQQECLWLSQACPFIASPQFKTIYATSLGAFLALKFSRLDAITLATMYTNQAVRCGASDLFIGTFPESQTDIPYLSNEPVTLQPQPFAPSPKLGLYPIVDDLYWVEFLLKAGVRTIQLRIKGRPQDLSRTITEAIKLANNYQALLFINDHWELALQLGAKAVHLGQEDLLHADLHALRQQGIILGVSTYSYAEVAKAHAVNPSYIAIGPIYETQSKDLAVSAQGIEGLKRWCRTLNYPLVAIGGISAARAKAVAATGVAGIALISAITQAEDPSQATRHLLEITS